MPVRAVTKPLGRYTGRPLTQLPLAHGAAHGDLNSDGAVDHVLAYSSGATRRRLGHAHEQHHTTGPQPHHSGGGGDAQRRAAGRREHMVCLGEGRSGVPTRELLWNASVCSVRHIAARGAHRPAQQGGGGGSGGSGGRERAAQGVATPLLLPRVLVYAAGGGGGDPVRAGGMDALFLASDGRVTSVGPDGVPNWVATTEAG